MYDGTQLGQLHTPRDLLENCNNFIKLSFAGKVAHSCTCCANLAYFVYFLFLPEDLYEIFLCNLTMSYFIFSFYFAPSFHYLKICYFFHLKYRIFLIFHTKIPIFPILLYVIFIFFPFISRKKFYFFSILLHGNVLFFPKFCVQPVNIQVWFSHMKFLHCTEI